MVHFECSTTQNAWETINEFMVTGEDKIKKSGMFASNQVIVYDCLFDITRAWVDPDLDFAKLFGYHTTKWNLLLGNYIDMNYLDLVKAQVQERELKNSQSYNISYKFSNQHDSGKGCLLSITFSRRIKDDQRRLVLSLRSSEVTKRLILDLLLAQRMGEYVYGEGCSLAVTIFCSNMWCSVDTLIAYHTHKDLLKFTKKMDTKVAKEIKKILPKYLDEEYAESIKYKVHQRTARQLIAKDGFIGYKANLHTYAKDCKLPGQ